MKDYIPHEYQQYYEEIFDWPNTTEASPDSDVEGDDEG